MKEKGSRDENKLPIARYTVSRLELQNGISFAELVAILRQSLLPFDEMWPYFWLKAAAILDEGQWRLCHFTLSGRWSEARPTRELRDKGEALVAASYLLTASRAYEMLAMLAQNSKAEILPSVIAAAPPDTVWSGTSFYWQQHVSLFPPDIADVAEQPYWQYLLLLDSKDWLSNNAEAHGRIMRTIQADLDERDERSFESFLSARLLGGHYDTTNYSLTRFRYTFDLPLALNVERGTLNRQVGEIPFTVRCRRPLDMRHVDMTVGPFWSSDAEDVPKSDEKVFEDGWSACTVSIPYGSEKLWMSVPALDKKLASEIRHPSRAQELRETVGSIYSKFGAESSAVGIDRWKHHLLDDTGADFELALANALARLGIPVLFGGQVPDSAFNSITQPSDALRQAQPGQKAKSRSGGGTATPGYDLIALDLPYKRAVTISAKGSDKTPGYNDVQSILARTKSVASALPGWTVFGIIASHAPLDRLGSFAGRKDVRVWSREDLQTISEADRAEVVNFMLWLPPWVPPQDAWRYHLRYVEIENI